MSYILNIDEHSVIFANEENFNIAAQEFAYRERERHSQIPIVSYSTFLFFLAENRSKYHIEYIHCNLPIANSNINITTGYNNVATGNNFFDYDPSPLKHIKEVESKVKINKNIDKIESRFDILDL